MLSLIKIFCSVLFLAGLSLLRLRLLLQPPPLLANQLAFSPGQLLAQVATAAAAAALPVSRPVSVRHLSAYLCRVCVCVCVCVPVGDERGQFNLGLTTSRQPSKGR